MAPKKQVKKIKYSKGPDSPVPYVNVEPAVVTVKPSRKKANKPPVGFPSEISVLGQIFTVKYIQLADDLYGETDGREHVININRTLSPDVMHATLIHEMFHAALAVSGLCEVLGETTEEAVVTCFEHLFSKMISFNKAE